MRFRYALLLLGILASALGARAQITASASVDRTTIGAGDILLLTLELEGDLRGLREPEPPATRNLALVQSTPHRSFGVQIVNGRRSEQMTLQWTYQPLGTGGARLGPITVRSDYGTIQTDAIRVDVVPQAQRPPATSTPRRRPSTRPLPSLVAPESGMEVRAEVSEGEPYVGEQVVVDYVLIYDPERFQPVESQLLGAWEAAGLWREEMDVPYSLSIPRPNTARTHYEVTIKRLAVFPARSGPVQIEPIALEVGGRRTVTSRGLGGSLFDMLRGRNTRFVEERVEMPAVELEARPLPDGAPASFTGAVGQYRMIADVDPMEARDGEAVALRVDLRGTGNAALLDGPEVPLPDGLTRYDIDEDRRIFRGIAPLNGQKVFTHQIAAEHAGTFRLPVEWSYFDPDAGRYETLRDEPVLQVVGAAAARPETEAAPPSDALPDVTWEAVGTVRPLHRRPWVWASLALPLLALAGVAANRRLTDYRSDLSPEARRRRAPATARSAIAEGRSALLRGDDAGTTQIDRAVRAFLHDRFGLAPSLPRPVLDAALAERQVSAETRQRLTALLVACERSQFAPRRAPATPALADEADALVEALHASAPPSPTA